MMRRMSIVQGEHAVVAEPNVVITTLLGSCVAVCLHDAEARIGGMNHFLLGEPDPAHKIAAQDMHRYGVHAMELLINEMMRKGASRSRLRAHVYGGATIIAAFGGIGTANGDFALKFLRTENIPVGRCEIGGTAPRKVEFIPWEGKVRSFTVEQAPAPVQITPPLSRGDGDVELF
jgi:chemotaxis protein CheD